MSTTQNTKERLILNFTVQERERLKQLYLKSHSASESDFVRRAVELYADLYQRVLSGAKIVLRNEHERRQVNVSVPTHWNREDMPLPERETPRRNFELKIEGTAKEQITLMVKAGAAPSATRLAWAAIGAYALIVEREQQGFALFADYDGKFTSIAKPNQMESSLVEHTPTFTSVPQVPRVSLSEVLNLELNYEITDFYIDAPFLTFDRWPNDRKRIIDVMTHNFRTKCTHYSYLLESKEKEKRLVKFIEDEFVSQLGWDAFDSKFHPELMRKVARLDDALKAKCEKSPVWALLTVGVLDLQDMVKKGTALTKLEHIQTRLFRTAYWYAILKNGSYIGFKFPQSDPPPSREAYLNPLDEEEVRERIKSFHTLPSDGVRFINAPEPLAVFERLHPQTLYGTKEPTLYSSN